MRKLTSYVAACALAAVVATPVAAQADRGGAGLLLGVGATYTPSFDLQFDDAFDDESVDGGFGFAARAGFAFTPVFVVFGAYEQSWNDIAGVDDTQLRHLFGGVRLNLPLAPSLAPYVSGGWGERRMRGTVSIDDEFDPGARVELTGNFFDVGGGIAVYMTPALTFDAGVNYSFGDFDELRVGGVGTGLADITANVFRVRVGLTWMPMTGR